MPPWYTRRAPEAATPARQGVDRSRQSAVDPVAATIKHRSCPPTTTSAASQGRHRPPCGDAGRDANGRARRRRDLRRHRSLRGRRWPSAPNPLGTRRGGPHLAAGAQAVRSRHAGTARRRGDAEGTLLDYLAGASPTLRAALGPDRPLHRPGHPQHQMGDRRPRADGLTMFEPRQATWPPRPFRIRAARVRHRPGRHAASGDWFDRRPREVWFAHAAAGAGRRVPAGARLPGPLRARADRRSASTTRRWRRRRSGHDPQLFRLLEAHAERVLAEMPSVGVVPRAGPPRRWSSACATGSRAIGRHRPGAGGQRALAAAEAAGRRGLVPRRGGRGPPQAGRRLPGRREPSR